MNLKALSITILVAVILFPLTSSAAGSHSRKGYVTKKGTYVAPSRATNPNKTQRDNYSSKGNINPYNGKMGRREPSK
jgi:hypothetical protein